MAHANIVDNELVDDDRIPVRDLPFADRLADRMADRMASKFSDQIEQLVLERSQVPVGWHGIFDHAVCSLRAVDCPKRDGIEISEVAYNCGSLHTEVYYAPVDKVVRGILGCLSRRSACTCQHCGRRYGAVYRESTHQTLCGRCDVRSALSAELDRWLGKPGATRPRGSRAIIELESLPVNIQLLIPRGQIKSLSLVSGDRVISYVTPDDVKAHLDKLVVMKRYMDQSCKT